MNECQIPVTYDNIVFSLQKAGGISVVWYELLSRIKKNDDFCCRFIDYHGDNMFRDGLDLGDATDYRKGNMLPILRYLPVRQRGKTPFIFHSSYYRICKNPCAINITTVHDFTYEYYRSGLARQLHSRQKFQAIRHSEAIVCVSENTKKDLLKLLPEIDERKIHVIYNAVSEDYYVDECLDTKNLPFNSGSYVVFIGSRAGYKNFDFLVRSIAKTNVNLVTVGTPLSNDEENLVSKYIPAKRFKYMGYLSNQELNIIYNHALALAYPSSYEGFGIPVLEAQRAGCPVIALNASSIPEVIGDTPLLMNELTEEEFLSKLDILADKAVRDDVIRKGLLNAKRFNWDKMYNGYLSLYKSLWASVGGNF